MRQYNLTLHSGIQCAPFERYQATKDAIRLPQSRDWLDECFLNRITRKVRKDATVSIDTLSYDVPMQFISQTVDIRYEPNNMDSAFILFDGRRYPIRRTNKVDNCHTKRNNACVDYSKFC